VSGWMRLQAPPCERFARSTPGALAPVRVMLSRSILAYSAPSAPLAGTFRLHRLAAYTRCPRCAYFMKIYFKQRIVKSAFVSANGRKQRTTWSHYKARQPESNGQKTCTIPQHVSTRYFETRTTKSGVGGAKPAVTAYSASPNSASPVGTFVAGFEV